MALVKCPECGRENVSDNATSCPNCAFPIKTYFDEKKLNESNKLLYNIKKELREENRVKELENKKIIEEKKIQEESSKKKEIEEQEKLKFLIQSKREKRLFIISLGSIFIIIIAIIILIIKTTDFESYIRSLNYYSINTVGNYSFWYS